MTPLAASRSLLSRALHSAPRSSHADRAPYPRHFVLARPTKDCFKSFNVMALVVQIDKTELNQGSNVTRLCLGEHPHGFVRRTAMKTNMKILSLAPPRCDRMR